MRGERARPSSVPAAGLQGMERARVVTAAVLEGQENMIIALRDVNLSIINLTQCLRESVDTVSRPGRMPNKTSLVSKRANCLNYSWAYFANALILPICFKLTL